MFFNEGFTEYQDSLKELPIQRRVCFELGPTTGPWATGSGSSTYTDPYNNPANYAGGITLAQRAADAYLASASAASTQQAYSEYGYLSPYVVNSLATLQRNPTLPSSYQNLTPALTQSLIELSKTLASRVTTSKVPSGNSYWFEPLPGGGYKDKYTYENKLDPFEGFVSRVEGPRVPSRSPSIPLGPLPGSSSEYGTTYSWAAGPKISEIPSVVIPSVIESLSKSGVFGAPTSVFTGFKNYLSNTGPNPLSNLISGVPQAFERFYGQSKEGLPILASSALLAVPFEASGIGLPVAAGILGTGLLASFLYSNRESLLRAFTPSSTVAIPNYTSVPKYSSLGVSSTITSVPKVSSESLSDTTSIPLINTEAQARALSQAIAQSGTRANVNVDTKVGIRPFSSIFPPFISFNRTYYPSLGSSTFRSIPIFDSSVDISTRPDKPPKESTSYLGSPSFRSDSGDYYYEEGLGDLSGGGIVTRRPQVKGPGGFWSTLGLAVYAPNPSILGEKKIVGGWVGRGTQDYGSKVSRSRQSGSDSSYSTPGVKKSIFSIL